MHSKKLLFFFCFSLIYTLTFGQRVSNSPYSIYGIGDMSNKNLMITRMMGNIGSSYADPYHINPVNPASYASIYATAFDVGVNGKYTTLKEGSAQSSQWNGNLEYISLAFPLRNPINESYESIRKKYRIGMGVGLFRNSQVNYNITETSFINNIGAVQKNNVGSGGTYKFQWGTGLKYKDFSAGLNLGYMFGKVSFSKEVLFKDVELPYNNYYVEDYHVSGFIWSGGLLYSRILNKSAIKKESSTIPHRITFGLRGGTSTRFSSDASRLAYSTQNLGTLISSDTLENVKNDMKSGRLPAEVGIGMNYLYGEKFCIGVDFSTSKWSEYYNEANYENVNSLMDSYSMSLGGFLRPDYKSFTNYFKRVYYRYGVYYNQDPKVVLGNRVEDYGLSLGMGLPFVYQRKISHANIGINVGTSGKNTLIQENFIKINLGFTFNDDEWFLQRKYN